MSIHLSIRPVAEEWASADYEEFYGWWWCVFWCLPVFIHDKTTTRKVLIKSSLLHKFQLISSRSRYDKIDQKPVKCRRSCWHQHHPPSRIIIIIKINCRVVWFGVAPNEMLNYCTMLIEFHAPITIGYRSHLDGTSRSKGRTADNNLQPESKSWVEKCIHRNRLSDSTHLH